MRKVLLKKSKSTDWGVVVYYSGDWWGVQGVSEKNEGVFYWGEGEMEEFFR